MEMALELMRALGGLCTVRAVYDMIGVSDLLGTKHLWKVLRHREIDFKSAYEPTEIREEEDDEDSIIVTKTYRMCRHPQQLGMVIIILFSGLVITLDRLVFGFYMIGMIMIGIN